MTPVQCKMARAAVGWTVRNLATKAKVAPNTVTRFEGAAGTQERTVDAMRGALESAGVQFIEDGTSSLDGGPGVRLSKPRRISS